jgi:hypothetical protein
MAGENGDVMDPLIGYRTWLADRQGRLRSLVAPHGWWVVGTQPAATCHRPIHRFDETDPGPAPHAANHPCGFHAYNTLAGLLSHGAADGDLRDRDGLTVVRGVVEGGGRTQEHDLGWRAQYALAVAIVRFTPDDPCARSDALLAQYAASERYGIPLIDPKDA